MRDARGPTTIERERLLDRFEAAWQKGTPPSIAKFLSAAPGPARRALLHELIKIDLEYRWRGSKKRWTESRWRGGSLPLRPRLEDYVLRFPELDVLPIDLIVEEYRVRQRWGDRPRHGEFSRRFPDQETQVRIVLRRVDTELAGEQVTMDVRQARSGTHNSSATPDHDAHAQPPFPQLGRYVLGELLGTGAFGAVWRARDTELARDVAVKLPRSGQFMGPSEEERFLREARSAARLHHPGIVAIYDVGRDRDTLYIVSELVRGKSLAEWLRHRRLGPRQSAELVACLADALDFAHQQDVVHRDVKPSNIMLERTGRRLSPRLMDFGLALGNANDVKMTVDGQVLGTPAYISPEQLRNPHAVDGRTDIYSLGVILYELLTGELPFRGATGMLLDQVMTTEPRAPRRLNGRIPRDLETICLKCLAKDPPRRYATASVLAADLRRWLSGQPILARPVGWVGRFRLWCKRNPALAVTGGMVIGVLAGSATLPVAVVLTALVVMTISALFFGLHMARERDSLASSLAAARRDHQRTAATLRVAVKQCVLVREDRDRALAVAARADRRFALSQALVRMVLFELPDKIRDANSAAARSFLVRASLLYLNNLADEVRGEVSQLREIAFAYARVADLQTGLGHDVTSALACCRRSLELFEDLCRAQPGSAQAEGDLATSRRKLRDLERSLRGN